MDPELPKTLTHAAYVSKKLSEDMDQLMKDMAEFRADLDKASSALSAAHAAVQTSTPEDVTEALATKVEPEHYQVEEPETDQVEEPEEPAKRSRRKKDTEE